MEERVRRSSSSQDNKNIDRVTIKNISEYTIRDKASISARIRELENEWDTERALEVNMPIVALIGLALAAFVNIWWLIFPTLVIIFFLQHALQGWCPPLPIFRKLGYRTKDEIAKEKYALKLLRGDFDNFFDQRRDNISGEELFDAMSSK
jgi:hypothetical protein